MKEELMADIMLKMLPYLDNAQLKQLRQVMEHTLFHYDISSNVAKPTKDDGDALITTFIAAKRVEGCSAKTFGIFSQRTCGHI